MKVLISLIFFSLAFSVFAEDVIIIELHDETIDQMLLNASSDNDDEKYESVTGDQVRDVAAKYFQPASCVVAVSHPRA